MGGCEWRLVVWMTDWVSSVTNELGRLFMSLLALLCTAIICEPFSLLSMRCLV